VKTSRCSFALTEVSLLDREFVKEKKFFKARAMNL
jgi:hypothetical protein